MTSPRTWAVVDLGVLAENFRRAQELAGPAQVIPMVKCDAYGHGAAAVAWASLETGAGLFGVAFVTEGLALRESVPRSRVLVCTEPEPGEEDAAAAAGLTLTVYTEGAIDRIAAASRRRGAATEVHLKIDTGLHRLGAPPLDVLRLARTIVRGGLRLGGMWTHFATADDPGSEFLAVQRKLLLEAVDSVQDAGIRVPVRHAANSAATLADPAARLDAVRIGALLYGIRPSATAIHAERFQPVLSWHSRVALTRICPAGECVSYGRRYRLDTGGVVAVVPVGFGDGLPLLLGNRGDVLIGGRRRRIAGAVAMSHIMVDCGTDPVEPGDPVVILGRQGTEEISAEELAGRSGSTAYEVLTRIAATVPRTYHRG